MKLYELPRESFFEVVGSKDYGIYKLSHLDGMYSYCIDKEGEVQHFAVWTEVEEKDSYE